MFKLKRLLKIVAVNTAIVGLLAFGMEFLVRHFFPESHNTLFSNRMQHIEGRPFVQLNKETGFSLIPGYRSRRININSHGFRGPELPNSGQSYHTILAIGGSTTFGWNVSDSNSYPAQLEKFFQQQGRPSGISKPIVVINAGVPSYTSVQQFIHLKKVLRTLQPNLVLLCTGINDYYYSLLKNWYPDVLLFRSPPFLMGWISKNVKTLNFVRKIFTGTKPETDFFNEKAWEYFRAQVENMLHLCHSRKIPVAVVAQPFQGDMFENDQFSPFKQITHTKAFIQKSQLTYWQAVKEAALKYQAPTLEHPLAITRPTNREYFLDSCHPTPQGNQIWAEGVGTTLLNLALFN